MFWLRLVRVYILIRVLASAQFGQTTSFFLGPCLLRYRFEFRQRRLMVVSLHVMSVTVS